MIVTQPWRKKEFFIPFEIDKLIKAGEKKVKVLSTPDRWYGVTYKDDAEKVSNALKNLIDKGLYDGI